MRAEPTKMADITIQAYDHTGNRRIPTPVRVRDQVEWKKRGARGTYRAEVLEITQEKLKLNLLYWTWQPGVKLKRKPFWVSAESDRFLYVFDATQEFRRKS